MCQSLLALPIGFAVMIGALVFSGWSEKRTVCREKALLAAEDSVNKLQCNGEGDERFVGDIGFLSCPLDKSTFTTFDISGKVKGLNTLPNVGKAVGIALKAKHEMMQCIESCQEEGGSGNSGGHEVCTYSLEWKDTTLTSGTFKDPNAARSHCGTSQNPGDFGPVNAGIEQWHAEAGSVKLEADPHFWRLNEYQIARIPALHPVDLNEGQWGTFNQDPNQPPAALNPSNTFYKKSDDAGPHIATCDNPTVGCLRLFYSTTNASAVTILSKVAGGGSFADEGWEAPADWICKGSTINRICPVDTTTEMDNFDLHKGIEVCAQPPEGPDTEDELFTLMGEENNKTAWLYRGIGWGLTVVGIVIMLSPIGTMGDSIADGLDWIPFMGAFAEIASDIIWGIILGFSATVGTGLFLFVVSIMWLVMRPLIGCAMLAGSLAFCACGAFCASSAEKGNKKRKKKKSSSDSESESDSDSSSSSSGSSSDSDKKKKKKKKKNKKKTRSVVLSSEEENDLL